MHCIMRDAGKWNFPGKNIATSSEEDSHELESVSTDFSVHVAGEFDSPGIRDRAHVAPLVELSGCWRLD